MVERQKAVTQESIDQKDQSGGRGPPKEIGRKQKANEGMPMAPYLRAMTESQTLDAPFKDPQRLPDGGGQALSAENHRRILELNREDEWIVGKYLPA
jgi:hypothetical protein